MKQEPVLRDRLPNPLIPGALYTLQDFQQVTGMRKTAIRTAREAGLKIRYVGGRAFIFSQDFQDFLKSHGKESEPKK